VPPKYAPMIPTQVREPFHRDGWVYEEKIDGKASPCVGGRTRSWLKVKVPGWIDPEDRWKRVRIDRNKVRLGCLTICSLPVIVSAKRLSRVIQ
jgi:hypothetical protein